MENWNLKPKRWSEVFGQEHLKPYIISAIKAGNYPKFSIYSGKPGVGKSVTSELVAKTICCENSDVEPCGHCDTCLEPLGGAVKKFNMGKFSKKEINEIISSIFDYKSMRNQQVYILEEMHAIKQEDQIVFLEELTRIPEGVYIIMCTTQLYRLIPELRDRGIIFNFEPLTTSECLRYAQFICSKLNVKNIDLESLKYLCEICENIPRQVLKTLEFFSTSDNISKESLMTFLGIIEDQEIDEVLRTVYNADNVVALSEYLCNKSTLKIVKRLREYLVTVLFEHSSKRSKNNIVTLYGEHKFLKMLEFTCDTLESNMPNNENLARLFFVRLFLQLKEVSSINKEIVLRNTENSSIQSVRANQKPTLEAKEDASVVSHDELSLDELQSLGGFGAVYVDETDEFEVKDER